jgi:nicotinamide riboside kinase
MNRGFVVALVGAESTGKTTLASSLHEALVAQGRRVALVCEVLREFCEREGRTPVASEQAGIAAEQTRRIDAAAAAHEIVIADTTALMIAVYSDMLFADRSLYVHAESAQRRCDLTLLTALDLPWQADGLQRDGPHVREPVDTLVRAALQRTGLSYAVVSGAGPDRHAAALNALRRALDATSQDDEARANPPWHWVCERCGDVDCERHLLPRI